MAYKQLKRIIDKGGFDLIHCHTPVGGLLARMAAKEARKKGCKIIYTAHGFHFYKGAPVLNWMLYYPIERMLAKQTDVLVTINKEDYIRAKRFKAGKVIYVPGVGIDFSKFNNRCIDRALKREELGIENDDFVILSVGELISRKNHVIVLEALSVLKKKGQLGNIKYVICGQGILEGELKEKAKELKITEIVKFAGYRNDICEICQMSDMFVFMSLQEGLPVALMEAMASGLPVICSKIRGNTDLVCDGVNGVFSDFSSMDLANKIYQMKKNTSKRQKIGLEASKIIMKHDINNVKDIMRKVYLDEIGNVCIE